MPAKDVTLTAQYTAASTLFNINITPTDGTADKAQVALNETVTLTPPETLPEGMQLKGWTVTPADQNIAPFTVPVDTASFQMPASNVTVKAVLEPIPYTLTINPNNGVASTIQTVPFGTTVQLNAPTVPTNKRFVGWKINDGTAEAILPASQTSYTMPAKDVTLTAQYVPIYYVEVVNGVGDGWYAAGDIVWIDAYSAPAGEIFYGWHSSDLNLVLSNIFDANTSFVMPDHDVTMTAWYANEALQYSISLTVLNGSGDGNYLPGSKVVATADPAPPGYVFDRWITRIGQVTYNNRFDPQSVVTTSGFHTTIEATYRPINVTPLPMTSIDRISGYDRIGTAIEVSQSQYASASAVIIARSDMPFDALEVASLAKSMNAPILLTDGASLDARVAREIARLGAKHAYVFGGPLAVSNNTFSQLQKVVSNATRIGGGDRYETATLIAQQVLAKYGNQGKVIIATGESYYDAIAVSSYAAKAGLPVVLVQRDSIPAVTEKFLSDHGFKEAIVIGGTTAISNSTVNALGIPANRVSGATRYETSVAIANEFFPTATHAFLVSGENFSDALVTGPVSASYNAPILLTTKDHVPTAVANHLAAHNYTHITIVGGHLAVSGVVQNTLH